MMIRSTAAGRDLNPSPNVEALAESPSSTLSGVARALVGAAKLSSKAAEDLAKSALERKISFIAAVIASGAVSPADLAHILSATLALPLIDLAAVDAERLPKGLVDLKLSVQYQLVVLGRRARKKYATRFRSGPARGSRRCTKPAGF